MDCEEQLLNEIRASDDFSIQLDESTTISSEAIPFVYARYITKDTLRNDLLFSVNLTTTTKGEDKFNAVDTFFQLYHLKYENLIGCCTNGAASMMGKNTGFNTKLKAMEPRCRIIHCFIHRQALAAKKLSEKLIDVLNVCIKVVNLLKSRPLNSRLFAELCADEDHQYLLLHT